MSFIGSTTAYPTVTPGNADLVPLVQGGVLKTATVLSLGGSVVTALTVSSGVVNIDLSLGDYFTLAPTANVTSVTFSNKPGAGHGFAITIKFTQDTTPRTVALPSGAVRPGGAGAVPTGSGAKCEIGMISHDNGASVTVVFSDTLS